MRRGRLLLLAATVAAAASCAEPETDAGDGGLPPEAPASPAEPAAPEPGAAPIRTDAARYELTPSEGGWRVRIPFTFTNPSPDTLYAVNCNGAITLALERREAGGWAMFWMPMTNACLSPPVVVPPGEAFRDTVHVWGAPPGGNAGPAFPAVPVEGTFRLIWTNVVHRYEDGAPMLGDTVPTADRVSNPFELRTHSPSQ